MRHGLRTVATYVVGFMQCRTDATVQVDERKMRLRRDTVASIFVAAGAVLTVIGWFVLVMIDDWVALPGFWFFWLSRDALLINFVAMVIVSARLELCPGPPMTSQSKVTRLRLVRLLLVLGVVMQVTGIVTGVLGVLARRHHEHEGVVFMVQMIVPPLGGLLALWAVHRYRSRRGEPS